ncbi:hypothetical protein F8388_006889 [Cannabis sativa]|uniref:Uncharacterized protein n=1 Tax=Cannabis sativa TaxID=3483 RepID=A0A7J6GVH3_CANSA|nr:hypothetical protein F8388_006889 [Cannabis sativa]
METQTLGKNLFFTSSLSKITAQSDVLPIPFVPTMAIALYPSSSSLFCRTTNLSSVAKFSVAFEFRKLVVQLILAFMTVFTLQYSGGFKLFLL